MISNSQTDRKCNSYPYGSCSSGVPMSLNWSTTATTMTGTRTGYGMGSFQHHRSALPPPGNHRNNNDANGSLSCSVGFGFSNQRLNVQTTPLVETSTSPRQSNDDQSLFLQQFMGRRQAIGDRIRNNESFQIRSNYLQRSANTIFSLEGQGHLGDFESADANLSQESHSIAELPGTAERLASRQGFMNANTNTNFARANSNYHLSSYLSSRLSVQVNAIGNRSGFFQPSVDFSSNSEITGSTAASGSASFNPIDRLISNRTNVIVPEGLRLPDHRLPNAITYHEDDPGWEEQFKALAAFHKENGHCKVPARYSVNPKLGRWVMTQRRQFTLMVQGYSSALTIERIQRLESIGFTWSIRPEPKSSWNIKFNELKAYKEAFGNCMVPQRYQANPSLGTWVHTQRRQYKLMKEGKKSSMTQEKAKALDSIGFYWAAKNALANTNPASARALLLLSKEEENDSNSGSTA
mmetsp:Transcript_29571/g.62151  ORF Transcript_29571/g.62151 Transcript_29571/m.62151 type:complete len:465 (+) Transcript_29571:37-1431(+)